MTRRSCYDPCCNSSLCYHHRHTVHMHYTNWSDSIGVCVVPTTVCWMLYTTCESTGLYKSTARVQDRTAQCSGGAGPTARTRTGRTAAGSAWRPPRSAECYTALVCALGCPAQQHEPRGQCSGGLVQQLEHELARQQQGLRGAHHGLLDVIQHLCAHRAVQHNSTAPDGTVQRRCWSYS
jgi:hypothetical protein